MSSVKQNFRSLLTDVERFLVETLKSVKLGSSARDERDRLVEGVRQLLDDIPGSASSTLNTSSASSGSHKTSAGDSAGGSGGSASIYPSIGDEDASHSDEIPKAAASSLKDKLQSGVLDKKKRSGFKQWEQLYCVISGNVFYIYKKSGDSKQKAAFLLPGYEFREAPSLEKDPAKKDCCFELTKPGAPSYQFRAGSKEGLVHWREAFTKGMQIQADGEEPGETYDDVSPEDDAVASPLSPLSPMQEEVFEDIYEEFTEDGIAGITPTHNAPAAATPPDEEETFDELYDDAESVMDDGKRREEEEKEKQKKEEEVERRRNEKKKKKEEESRVVEERRKREEEEEKGGDAPPPLPPPNKRREPPLPPSTEPPPPPPPKSDLPAIPKSIPPPIPERRPSNALMDPPPVPNTNPPPLPGSLPPRQTNPSSTGGRGSTSTTSVSSSALRIPQLRKPFLDRDEDFENLYLGKWDCEADTAKELAFCQGDVIHVLSRDFDAESWWVGELGGKVGLVPKDYLCSAFVEVA